jgi:hypothetical protein
MNATHLNRKTPATQSTPVAEAIRCCDWLAQWLKAPDLATVNAVDGQFERLKMLIEAIPPTIADRAVICYLRNRHASTLTLRNAGDYHTAAYQLREMSRKLARL